MATSYAVPTGSTKNQLDLPKGRIDRNTGLAITTPQAPAGPTVIPVDSLTAQQKPMVVPPIQPNTQSLGVMTQIGTQADSFLSDLQKSADRAAQNKDTSLDALIQGMNTEGETQLQDRLYSAEGGVDDLSKQLQTINAQILSEKEALLSQEEALRKNPQGLYGGALEDKIQELRDDSLVRSTRLAIQQYVATNNLSAAREIADRSVRALTEKNARKVDMLRLIYEDNKDEFNEKERRSFEAAQADRERKLENEEYRLRAKFDQQIKMGDPLYQAQLAKARYDLAQAKKDAALEEAKKLTPEEQKNTLNRDISIVKNALDNSAGLEAASGLLQQKGFFGTLAQSVLESPLGPLSAPYVAARKQDFLADAGYVVSNLAFDKIAELQARGVKLTPISEMEFRAMKDSASPLVSAAKFDDKGNLTGFNMAEDKVRKHMSDVLTHYEKAVADINANTYLSEDDLAEINSL